MGTRKHNDDYGSIPKKELKILPHSSLEATINKNSPQSKESNVDVNGIAGIDASSTKITPNSITANDDVTLNSMLTHITTMGEKFVHCINASFQNNHVSYLTDTACELDAEFDGNPVTVPSSHHIAHLLSPSYTTSAEKSSF